ncbi:MAG: helix-turn-helix domain-containing protein [Candidatus Cyclobacteriaceae bacterium M2_1C_046]
MAHSLSAVAKLAVKYVNTTQRNVFLTGKAGSGKTTLLKYIIDNTYKNAVVAAPTGIAAINAEGVTLHSLLQLPFGTFLPENISFSQMEYRDKLNTPESVISQLQMTAKKRALLKEIELLIIDEVSMLRADLLDCIDLILRNVRRRRTEPFGGVQLLFIGDLNQLPPVVKNSEWPLLSKYYSSAYFFESHALKAAPPVFIELDKIYRQSDQEFIDILNRLRENQLLKSDMEQLNSHYVKNFSPKADEGYIHITTHNKKSDIINTKELEKIKSSEFNYEAVVTGDFPEHMHPLPERLTLKEGAQVMFIKNDPSGEGQFFNGKIGQVTALSEDYIDVTLNDSQKVVHVKTYVWENKRYKLNGRTNEIEENIIGSFEQYPIKLAWAITVHKSQGLTFDKAILDLSDSFAPGQMYVALSRLTALKGLVLSSPIPDSHLEMDEALTSFAKSKKDKAILLEELNQDRKKFLISYAGKAFNFSNILQELKKHIRSFDKDEKRSLKQQYLSWTQELYQETDALHVVGVKFSRQLTNLAEKEGENYLEVLHERVSKAEEYFLPLMRKLMEKIDLHKKEIGNKQQVKMYSKEIKELQLIYKYQVRQIQKVSLLFLHLSKDKIPGKKDLLLVSQSDNKKNVKDTKTPTKEISYNLYKEKLSVEEIALKRGLSPTTIEGHLSVYVSTGDIPVSDFIEKEKIEQIIIVAKELDTTLLNEIKAKLGDEFSYGDIRMALAYQKFLDQKEPA